MKLNKNVRAYYQKAFPTAEHFMALPIPSGMNRAIDRGNDIYIEVRDAQEQRLGYIRDIDAPVTIGVECPCSPLKLSLVFTDNGALKTILTPAPLNKKDHVPMSAAELQRLITIAQAPSQQLLEIKRVEDMVDGVTEATKQNLQGEVIPNAALSTRRIVDLVLDTQKIIHGAPELRDNTRLQAIADSTEQDLPQRVLQLAAFIPAAESLDTQIQALHLMLQAYLTALKQTSDLAPAVHQALQSALFFPARGPENIPEIALDAAYRIAQIPGGLNTAQSIFNQALLPRDDDDRPAVATSDEAARLKGTLAFQHGAFEEALSALEQAAGRWGMQEDPLLHWQWVQALAQSAHLSEACQKAAELYMEHSLLPGINVLLQRCADFVEPLSHLQARQKQALVKSISRSSTRVPTLAVENDTHQSISLNPAAPGKLTVLVFFATWCPHCQSEMPKLVEFVEYLHSRADLAASARVLGIRTAMEREVEPYDTFKQRFGVNFPIYNDAALSMAFSQFAKAMNIPAHIPIVCVLDDRGYIRLRLTNGIYRNTSQELLWALEALRKDKY
ncbi:MAG: TlpA disulfide reductase family protein [Myxococcota bacterium]